MSSISKLRALTTKPATIEHQEEYDKQTSDNADDRSFCLLLTSMLENMLDKAVDYYFGELSPEVRNGLYNLDGPLGNFSRKIALAAALDILGPVSIENFRLMRNVRNAFAHAKIPIKFDTPEVSAVCAELKEISLTDPPEDTTPLFVRKGRDQFEAVCHQTMIRLAAYTGHDPKYIGFDGKPHPVISDNLP